MWLKQTKKSWQCSTWLYKNLPVVSEAVPAAQLWNWKLSSVWHQVFQSGPNDTGGDRTPPLWLCTSSTFQAPWLFQSNDNNNKCSHDFKDLKIVWERACLSLPLKSFGHCEATLGERGNVTDWKWRVVKHVHGKKNHGGKKEMDSRCWTLSLVLKYRTCWNLL